MKNITKCPECNCETTLQDLQENEKFGLGFKCDRCTKDDFFRSVDRLDLIDG